MTGGNSEAAVRIGEIVKSDEEAYRTINCPDMPMKYRFKCKNDRLSD